MAALFAFLHHLAAFALVSAIAVEFARRVIPEEVRPSFEKTEELCRHARSDSPAMAA